MIRPAVPPPPKVEVVPVWPLVFVIVMAVLGMVAWGVGATMMVVHPATPAVTPAPMPGPRP